MPISLQNAHPWASLSWRQVALGSVFQALGCGHHRVRARTRPPTGGHRGQLSRVAFALMGGEWGIGVRQPEGSPGWKHRAEGMALA